MSSPPSVLRSNVTPPITTTSAPPSTSTSASASSSSASNTSFLSMLAAATATSASATTATTPPTHPLTSSAVTAAITPTTSTSTSTSTSTPTPTPTPAPTPSATSTSTSASSTASSPASTTTTTTTTTSTGPSTIPGTIPGSSPPPTHSLPPSIPSTPRPSLSLASATPSPHQRATVSQPPSSTTSRASSTTWADDEEKPSLPPSVSLSSEVSAISTTTTDQSSSYSETDPYIHRHVDKVRVREKLRQLDEHLSSVRHVGLRPRIVPLSSAPTSTSNSDGIPCSVFNPEDPGIKRDIISMIIQYLASEGYYSSMLTVRDEAQVRYTDASTARARIKRIRKSILDGDWVEAEKLCTKHTIKNYKALLYELYKQQYLEMIDRQEYQKAFTFLNRRLKSMESLKSSPDEFADLCYLLTCKSVQEAPSFREWSGAISAREQLVERFQSVLDVDSQLTPSNNSTSDVPPHRLLQLLQQATAYQIEMGRYRPLQRPHVTSLLIDYQCLTLPNTVRHVFTGHTQNVKAVIFVGENGERIASGSSDNTIRLWSSSTGRALSTCRGHISRIWDIACDVHGHVLASASADSLVKVWNIREGENPTVTAVLRGHEADVYACSVHPAATHVVSGGYDRTVRVYDVETQKLVRTLNGHKSAVCSTIFNPHGNMVISGSKDSTIKFWDLVSGVCVKTYSSHLGEVTSVEMSTSGTTLLSSSKDNSCRLWDLRLARPIQRYKGHQNTSRNFIRASFGPNQSLIQSGSEDGRIYIWDSETGNLVQRLEGHGGIVYGVAWHPYQSLLVSCSQDETVRTWWYDPDRSQPLLEPSNTSTSTSTSISTSSNVPTR